MRRLIAGAAIGVVATLLFQYGHQWWKSWQWRYDTRVMEWQHEALPGILGADSIHFIESRSWTGKWPIHERFSSLWLYEKSNTYKIIRIDARVDDGKVSFPSEADIRAQDEHNVGIPIPREDTTNTPEVITFYSLPVYLLRKVLMAR